MWPQDAEEEIEGSLVYTSVASRTWFTGLPPHPPSTAPARARESVKRAVVARAEGQHLPHCDHRQDHGIEDEENDWS